MAQTVLSIKKYHTFAQISGQQHHNDRDFPLPNVDPTLSHQNAVIRRLCPGKDYSSAWRLAVDAASERTGKPVHIRKNAVLMLEIVTSFSPDATGTFSVYEWAEANAEWMEGTFGKENIVACTLHMDESTPHIHTEIVPIDDRGRLCAKSFTSGRMAMMSLHTSYAKAMERFGLRRGEEHSKATKVELREFYKGLKAAYEEPLPKREAGESTQDYMARLDAYAKTLRVALYNASLQIDAAKAGNETAAAKALYRYSEAAELFEDISQTSNLSDEEVNDRIREYRMMEVFSPKSKNDLLISSFVDNIKEQGHDYDDLPTRFKKRRRRSDEADTKTMDQITEENSATSETTEQIINWDDEEISTICQENVQDTWDPVPDTPINPAMAEEDW